jgi:hypothetical protein
MKGKKHRLLIYDVVHRQRRGLFLLAALLFAGLYALPFVLDKETAAKLWPADYDWLFLAGGIIAFLVFLYKLVAPRLAYVQCTNKSVRIQTPLVPLTISYKRIHTTRPNQWGRLYPPEKRNRRTRRLIERIGGREVIILDLKSWPAPMGWLRLWIPEVMFSPDSTGLVLWVNDWMTLNRELRDFQDRRREALAGPREEASLYSRMRK